MSYKHKKLSFKERKQILVLVTEEKSIREIARLLGRSASSISEDMHELLSL